MTDDPIAAQLDDVLRRLRDADAVLDRDEDVGDLAELRSDISALCARAEAAPGPNARAALKTALDGLDALETRMRERHNAIEDRLRSAPDRKRALSAYGRS